MLRFAPSPTGDMDISDLRVAILNFVIAKQRQDSFLVRIDDTHAKRNIEGKDTEIMMLLEKFAIKHDSVYHQSEHLGIHQNLAIRLLQEGKAFVCRCQEESENSYSGRCEGLTKDDYRAIKESGDKFVVRLRKPIDDIFYSDIVQGDITTTPNEVDSFVILKADNTPTYDFACACDDMLSDIDFIIRKEEYLSNTPKQIHIKNSLGYERETKYAHLPIILNRDGKTVKWLFEEGFIPDAILNYLLLLGDWEAPKEIFTLPEAIEWLNLDTILKNPVKFNMDRLRFINREHIKMMDDKELSKLFGFADADIGKLAKLYLGDSATINELEGKIRSIFTPKNFDKECGKEMRVIEKIIFNAPYFDKFDEFKKYIAKESGLKGNNLIKPLRLLLTGDKKQKPKLSEIYPLIKSYILEVAS